MTEVRTFWESVVKCEGSKIEQQPVFARVFQGGDAMFDAILKILILATGIRTAFLMRFGPVMRSAAK